VPTSILVAMRETITWRVKAAREDRMTYRTVMVGSDGSTTAEMAVKSAAEIAASHHARLVIVAAYTPTRDEATRQSAVPDDVRWAVTDVNQAEDRVRHGRAIAAEAGVVDTVTHAVAGSPVDVLLDAALAFRADLLVVGSVGLTRSTRVLIGSVASSVAHHAPCDVMIVRTEEASEQD
jgi:nucleotide-binding universal stress UspA family protein